VGVRPNDRETILTAAPSRASLDMTRLRFTMDEFSAARRTRGLPALYRRVGVSDRGLDSLVPRLAGPASRPGGDPKENDGQPLDDAVSLIDEATGAPDPNAWISVAHQRAPNTARRHGCCGDPEDPRYTALIAAAR